MSMVRILSRDQFCTDRKSGSYSGEYLSESSFPVFYMSDYSVMGLLVDDLPLAVRALEMGNLPVCSAENRMADATVASEDLRRAAQLLHESGIEYDVTDLVHGIYQG